MFQFKSTLAAATLLAALAATPAHATVKYTFDANGTASGKVSFTASMTGSHEFNLAIGIDNTTPTNIGGALVNLGFLVPTDTSDWALVSQTNVASILRHNDVVGYFPAFDLCLTTSSSCDQGKVSKGIKAGDSASVVLHGKGDYSSASAFETALAEVLHRGHENRQGFGVCGTFAGLKTANSANNKEKLCAEREDSVPEPVSTGMLGAGLVGLLALRRRRA
ncbi:MAG: PEP-CTERM sorting domain-containing protein [Rhodospirillales bacterium]|nr:PEP-CTERM sorting domain-containing protein [Rhodospirillales bacterium]